MDKMPIKTKLSFDLKYDTHRSKVGQRVQPIVVEANGGILYISVADGDECDRLRLAIELDNNDKLVACCYKPGQEEPHVIIDLE